MSRSLVEHFIVILEMVGHEKYGSVAQRSCLGRFTPMSMSRVSYAEPPLRLVASTPEHINREDDIHTLGNIKLHVQE